MKKEIRRSCCNTLKTEKPRCIECETEALIKSSNNDDVKVEAVEEIADAAREALCDFISGNGLDFDSEDDFQDFCTEVLNRVANKLSNNKE